MISEKKIHYLVSLLLEGFYEMDGSGNAPQLEIDQRGRIIYANSIMLQLLSLNFREIAGNYLTNVLQPISSNPKSFHYVWQAVREGNLRQLDFIYTTKNDRKYRIGFKIQHMHDTTITFTCENIETYEPEVPLFSQLQTA